MDSSVLERICLYNGIPIFFSGYTGKEDFHLQFNHALKTQAVSTLPWSSTGCIIARKVTDKTGHVYAVITKNRRMIHVSNFKIFSNNIRNVGDTQLQFVESESEKME